MRPEDERKIEIISGINDDILEKSHTARLHHLSRVAQRRKKAWIPFVAMAACLVLVMSALLTILPNLNDPSLPPVDTEAPSYSTDAPIPKQIPIYEGMTASGTNPSGGHTTASVSPKASTVS